MASCPATISSRSSAPSSTSDHSLRLSKASTISCRAAAEQCFQRAANTVAISRAGQSRSSRTAASWIGYGLPCRQAFGQGTDRIVRSRRNETAPRPPAALRSGRSESPAIRRACSRICCSRWTPGEESSESRLAKLFFCRSNPIPKPGHEGELQTARFVRQLEPAIRAPRPRARTSRMPRRNTPVRESPAGIPSRCTISLETQAVP